MNIDNIIINHVKVFLRIINCNSHIDFAKMKYVINSGLYRVSVPVDNKDVVVLYSENGCIDPVDLVGIEFVLTLNNDLEIGFRKKVIKCVKNRDLSIRWVFPNKFSLSSVFHVYSPSILKKVMLKILFKLPFFGKLFLTDFYIHFLRVMIRSLA